VNWKSYGLSQSKNSLPQGPFVFAISVTSPFIKFKNASKETIDSSDELIEEIRRALMQAGQKLSRHIKREARAADLERKKAYIEKFGPILVEGLVEITGASEARKKKAIKGLDTILGKDADSAEEALNKAQERLDKLKEKEGKKNPSRATKTEAKTEEVELEEVVDVLEEKPSKKAAKKASKKAPAKKKASKKVAKKATKKAAKKKTQKKASRR